MRALYLNILMNIQLVIIAKYDGSEFHHLKNVVRLKENESVVIIDGNGLIVTQFALNLLKVSCF